MNTIFMKGDGHGGLYVDVKWHFCIKKKTLLALLILSIVLSGGTKLVIDVQKHGRLPAKASGQQPP